MKSEFHVKEMLATGARQIYASPIRELMNDPDRSVIKFITTSQTLSRKTAASVRSYVRKKYRNELIVNVVNGNVCCIKRRKAV